MTPREAVLNGISLFTRTYGTWAGGVDLARLNMADPTADILAQLCPAGVLRRYLAGNALDWPPLAAKVAASTAHAEHLSGKNARERLAWSVENGFMPDHGYTFPDLDDAWKSEIAALRRSGAMHGGTR